MADTTIPQPITSGSDQAGGGSPASTNIPPTPDAQNDAVKQSIVDAYPNSGPNVSNPNPTMPALDNSQYVESQGRPQAPVLQHAPADNSPKASAHARLFDGILKTLSGGPVKVLQSDPTTGETREVEVPQSKSKMADSILAGVLSSLFTGAQGRGASPDFKPVMGAHGTQHAEQQAAEQAKIDQMQDRKMKVVKSNMETIQSQLASARMEHIAQQQQIDDGAQQVAMAKEYDQNKAAGEPQSIQKEGLTHEDALEAVKNSRMQYIAVPTGWTSRMDASGKTVSEPTYSIIDPHVKVKLTADDRAMLAATNPQWANAPEGTEVPLSVVNSERLVRGKVHNVQSYLDQLAKDPATAKALGLEDGKVGNVMTAAQDRTLRDAINNTEIQMAHGAGTDIHYSVLDALLTAQGGPALAQKLGIDPDKARAWIDKQHDERMAAQARAKTGGVGPKALVDQSQIHALQDSIAGLPEADQKDFKAYIREPDEDGNIDMSTAELQKAQAAVATRITANRNNEVRAKLAGGDKEVAAQTANNIFDGALGNIETLAPNRSDARQVLNNAVIAEAKRRGLNEENWGAEALTGKTKMWGDYHTNDKNKTGGTITSFRTFLNHADEVTAISDNWKRTGSPKFDKTYGQLLSDYAGDPEFMDFKRGLEPVRKEYMSFLKAGHAEHAQDIESMKQILNDDSSPRQIQDALQYLAQSADARLAEVARTYVNTMGVTMPDILSPQAKSVLKRFNVKSMTDPLVAELPKGNGQPFDKNNASLVATFAGAAGGDMKKARELAKQAGWTGLLSYGQ